jgi:hypothetical protein
MSMKRSITNDRRAGLVRWATAWALAAAGGSALAMESGEYPPPDIRQFLLIAEQDGDGDGDGVEETHIRRYMSSAGDRVFSMTTGGRLWAWSLDAHGSAGAADPARDYVIRDSDCDGTFDERYRLDEEFEVPACLK